MNQHDMDALGMRLERITRNMQDVVCLLRVWAEISDCCGYFINDTDIITFANITLTRARRLNKDVIKLRTDFEFPISERH